MIRVRIWISGVPGIGHALLIEREQAPQECYALGNPPSRNARLGAAYSGDFEGHAGTYVDLPRGFPGDNATAAQRLNDPSIPQVIQQLIRESFPLRPRVRLVSRPRPAPQPRPVAQPQLIAQPQMVAQPQSVAQPQPVAQPPVAQLSR
ncbi:MAG: hypothetical protein JWN70_6802, partial [Planctomycetaceae bacterium]|nr:hypothetical protein [Planctomycetaceae bacterium]